MLDVPDRYLQYETIISSSAMTLQDLWHSAHYFTHLVFDVSQGADTHKGKDRPADRCRVNNGAITLNDARVLQAVKVLGNGWRGNSDTDASVCHRDSSVLLPRGQEAA